MTNILIKPDKVNPYSEFFLNWNAFDHFEA